MRGKRNHVGCWVERGGGRQQRHTEKPEKKRILVAGKGDKGRYGGRNDRRREEGRKGCFQHFGRGHIIYYKGGRRGKGVGQKRSTGRTQARGQQEKNLYGWEKREGKKKSTRGRGRKSIEGPTGLRRTLRAGKGKFTGVRGTHK